MFAFQTHTRLAVAVLMSALAFTLAPSQARADIHAMEATLHVPVAADRLISSGILWHCDGTSCAARSELTSSPRRFCARLAGDAGALAGFSVDGAVFDEAALDRCNKSAR